MKQVDISTNNYVILADDWSHSKVIKYYSVAIMSVVGIGLEISNESTNAYANTV